MLSEPPIYDGVCICQLRMWLKNMAFSNLRPCISIPTLATVTVDFRLSLVSSKFFTTGHCDGFFMLKSRWRRTVAGQGSQCTCTELRYERRTNGSGYPTTSTFGFTFDKWLIALDIRSKFATLDWRLSGSVHCTYT